MRQVDVRVMSPAIRYQASVAPFGLRRVNMENLLAMVILCLFWGVVLYLGLSALGQ